MSTSPVFKNFINGEWVDSSSGKTFENRNPANKSELVGTFQDSTEKDVEAAVAAAREGFKKWRLVPAPKRAEVIYEMGRILVERKEQYAREMTREMGKVIKETRGDVQEAIDTCYYGAGEGRRLFGQTTPSELPNKFQMCVRQPIGVCALITPWNFPMAIPSWKIIPALICGDAAVIKPATDTPLSTYNIVKAAQDAGLPPGVLNLVTGSGSRVGTPLLRSKEVRLVSFTGSSEVGRKLAIACAEDFKKLSLEMGGKNAIIVMDDADIDLAVDGAIWGGFGTTGQRCTATSRIIAHKSIVGEFTKRYAARARSLKVGNGLDASVDVGPLVNQSQLETVSSYVDIGLKEGAKLVSGGHRLDSGDHANGYFYAPTIFGEVQPGMRIAQEEIFGPVVSILTAENLEHAIELANGTVYGLSSSIYTHDINNAFVAMRDIDAGITYVNSPTIGAEVHLPFGGTKQTGNGHREGGMTVLDIFSEWKSIYVDYSGRLQKAQIDNN
ncbi:MAG: aldehyde dehydrogenase family protein [Acidobacteria bacterium]|nr:aldehyde dehydrogenase family protein [Acidobacteriota bacterium]